MGTTLFAAAAEQPIELPMSPLGFALTTIAVFGVLLAVTFAFHSVGKRH